jgi:hypothetical protein
VGLKVKGQLGLHSHGKRSLKLAEKGTIAAAVRLLSCLDKFCDLTQALIDIKCVFNILSPVLSSHRPTPIALRLQIPDVRK